MACQQHLNNTTLQQMYWVTPGGTPGGTPGATVAGVPPTEQTGADLLVKHRESAAAVEKLRRNGHRTLMDALQSALRLQGRQTKESTLQAAISFVRTIESIGYVAAPLTSTSGNGARFKVVHKATGTTFNAIPCEAPHMDLSQPKTQQQKQQKQQQQQQQQQIHPQINQNVEAMAAPALYVAPMMQAAAHVLPVQSQPIAKSVPSGAAVKGNSEEEASSKEPAQGIDVLLSAVSGRTGSSATVPSCAPTSATATGSNSSTPSTPDMSEVVPAASVPCLSRTQAASEPGPKRMKKEPRVEGANTTVVPTADTEAAVAATVPIAATATTTTIAPMAPNLMMAPQQAATFWPSQLPGMQTIRFSESIPTFTNCSATWSQPTGQPPSLQPNMFHAWTLPQQLASPQQQQQP